MTTKETRQMAVDLSTARKAASAMIAKIPFTLSSHIARVYKPTESNHADTP